MIFHISMSFPFQLLKVAVHVHRLTLPHFSLVKCRYPQERNMNWTHLQPYMPTKHTHLHNHIIAISRQSYICHIPHGFYLSLSLSLSLISSFHLRSQFPKLSKFLCKRNSCVPTFWVSRYIFWRWFRFNGVCRAFYVIHFTGYQICILPCVLIPTFMHGDLIQRL